MGDTNTTAQVEDETWKSAAEWRREWEERHEDFLRRKAETELFIAESKAMLIAGGYDFGKKPQKKKTQ